MATPGNPRREPKKFCGIRDHYAIGQATLKALHRGRPKTEVIRAMAEKHRLTPDAIRKDERFAELYSTEDLEALCSLRGRDGKPLAYTHVIQLITVKNRRVREQLQRRAAREGLTAKDLSRVIQEQLFG